MTNGVDAGSLCSCRCYHDRVSGCCGSIAAGMVAASAVKDHIKPYLELRKQIKDSEKEVVRLGERANEFNNPPVVLKDAEKKILVDKIENIL